MRHRPGGVLALLLTCSGCWSIEGADLQAIGAGYELTLTEAVLGPDEVEPLASLHVAKSGFYLFGFTPVVRVSLAEAVDELAFHARRIGADGVCNLEYDFDPPDPLKFVVFPIPDWGAHVQVRGMAYRRKPGQDVVPGRTSDR